MADLLLPNFAESAARGYEAGVRMRQERQAAQDQNALRTLGPQVMDGNVNAFRQAVAIDPAAAKNYDDAGTSLAKRAAGSATYILEAVARKNPKEIESRYQASLPFLTKMLAPHGKTPPAQFDPAMIPLMEQTVAEYRGRGGASGDELKSVRVGEDGYYYAIQNGQMVNTGVKADPRTVLRDQPGIAPSIVNQRDGTQIPLGGAPQPQQGAPVPAMGAGEVPYSIDPSLPPNVQADIRSRPNAYAQASEGNGVVAPGPTPLEPQVGQLNAARPLVTPAQEQQLDISRQANERAEEAARRSSLGNAPTGYRFNAAGGLEPIPGAPAIGQAAKPPTEGERLAAGFLGRMTAATSELDALEATGYDPANVRDAYTAGQGALRNWAATDQGQHYRQQKEDWVRAKLRKESGAAIPPDEMDREISTYFPQPGDRADVLASKKRSRQKAEEAMTISGGRALPQSTQNEQAPAAPSGVVDSLLLKYGVQ